MSWLKRGFIWLLVLLVLFILAVYFILQTRWAAEQISRDLSQHTAYQVNITSIRHSWNAPSEWVLEQVSLVSPQHHTRLQAKKIIVALGELSWHRPWHLTRLIISDGQLTLDKQHINDLALLSQVTSQVLQLKNVDIDYQNGESAIIAKRVDAGVTPWIPQAEDWLGDSHFQLSTQSLSYQAVSLDDLLIEGDKQQQDWQINNLGATIGQGQLTAQLDKEGQQGWHIKHLLLNNLHWQTAKTLSQSLGAFKILPISHIDKADFVNLQLEGKQWAASNLNITLQQWQQLPLPGQGYTGDILLNASNFTHNTQSFNNPYLQASLLSTGIEFSNITANWRDGLIQATGRWQKETQQLTLDKLTATGISYSLPTNSWHHWQQRLPQWLRQLVIKQITTNNILLSNPQSAFPWQFTALNCHGQDLVLVQQHQLGLWAGSMAVGASQATINQVDLQQPGFTLTGNDQFIRLQPLSALHGKGLMRGSLTVQQQTGYPFALILAGQNSDFSSLSHWGWSDSLKNHSDGEFHLTLNGQLDAPTVNDTLTGQLQLNNAQGREEQRLQDGQLTDLKPVAPKEAASLTVLKKAKKAVVEHQPNQTLSAHKKAQHTEARSSSPKKQITTAAPHDKKKPAERHHYNPLADTLATMLSQPGAETTPVIPPVGH